MHSLPTFQNADLLANALTHRSALNERVSSSTQSNERLEFLGDAVLELATTEFLYARFPEKPEGELTAFRSSLVKTVTLAQVAVRLGLGEQLYLSKGEEATGGRNNSSLLADTFEAVVGALYLDQGYETAKKFLAAELFIEFDAILEQKLYKDAKSQLQEVVQSKGFEAPTYEVVAEDGPDHDKQFTVTVSVGGKVRGTGVGKSKQLAQQEAATQGLASFG